MNTYRNKITGITFNSDCICSGDKWELVTAPAKPIKAKEVKEDTPVTPVKTTKRAKK